MSTAVTDGIRVSVTSEYRTDRSEAGRFLFTYTVRIENEGREPAQLLSRHWIITDARGELHEVLGDGVVGKQPHLEPGQAFEYTSFCVLDTPHGSMRGSYCMRRPGGREFEAEIAPFPLVVPGTVN
ncbi:MAG TPA: Co2+/Mg2+ efflux protein ApaG [Anaeromyxobacter sp.]|nr:Co2+/Mg2+ efflux protein ApaG [Anaeromyxobacter sp.]